MWIGIGWVLLLVMVWGLFKQPIRVTLMAGLRETDLSVTLSIRYLRFFHYDFAPVARRRKEPVPSQPHTASGEHDATTILETWSGSLRLVPEVADRLRSFRVCDFQWGSRIGAGDAALTAITAGSLWSIKGGVVGVMSNYLTLVRAPNLNVEPCFSAAVFESDVLCIVESPLGQAIMASLRLYRLLHGRRERDANATPGSSHSVNDANRDGEPQRDGGRQHDHRRSS
ncbi:MAG: DUF2953 domain-containing protein [Firmicutes bacterium]|nr:DUF2953 domain-containing protein [Bacillota bacterium]